MAGRYLSSDRRACRSLRARARRRHTCRCRRRHAGRHLRRAAPLAGGIAVGPKRSPTRRSKGMTRMRSSGDHCTSTSRAFSGVNRNRIAPAAAAALALHGARKVEAERGERRLAQRLLVEIERRRITAGSGRRIAVTSRARVEVPVGLGLALIVLPSGMRRPVAAISPAPSGMQICLTDR